MRPACRRSSPLENHTAVVDDPINRADRPKGAFFFGCERLKSEQQRDGRHGDGVPMVIHFCALSRLNFIRPELVDRNQGRRVLLQTLRLFSVRLRSGSKATEAFALPPLFGARTMCADKLQPLN